MSSEVDIFIKENYINLGSDEVSNILGLTKKAVQVRASRLGVSKKVEPKPKGFIKSIGTGYLEIIGNRTIHRSF
jgi:hypothetical protein